MADFLMGQMAIFPDCMADVINLVAVQRHLDWHMLLIQSCAVMAVVKSSISVDRGQALSGLKDEGKEQWAITTGLPSILQKRSNRRSDVGPRHGAPSDHRHRSCVEPRSGLRAAAG